MNIQIITTPSGDRLALMPEADYLNLVEAADLAQDSAAIERFKARLVAGEEELVPAAVVNALLDGANPVRVWRDYRGLSAKDLAQRADLAPAYLSQIETGKREGTVETLRKIAQVLNVTIDDLAG